MRKVLLGLLICLLLIIISNPRLSMAMFSLFNLGLSINNNLNQAVGSLKQYDFKQAIIHAKAANDSATKLADRFGAADKDWMMKFNPVKNRIYELQYLTRAIGAASTAFYNISLSADSVYTITKDQDFAKLSVSDRGKIIMALYEISPELQGAKANIDLALLNLDNIKIKPLLGIMMDLKDKLILIDEVINKVATLTQIIPTLAGYPEPKDYLFILQNNDELRPTGGFIGTLGMLRINAGKIENLETRDVYHLDMPASKLLKIEPPAPLKKYLGVNYWYLRDANWSPDFSESAKNIINLYKQEANLNSDIAIKTSAKNLAAVIAITPRLITDLLYLTGPINVGGKDYTKDNFVEVLQQDVEVDYLNKGISEWDRKKTISLIMEKMREKLGELPASRYQELLNVFNENVEQKNILVYFTDEKHNLITKNFNWSGQLQQPAGDYLMVVDANLAAFKSDRVMDKTISYNTDGKRSTLTLTYKHSGGYDWKTTKYRDYLRVYTPINSKLISGPNFESYSENNKTVFAGFITIEPGETKTIILEYEINVPSNYQIYFQKQPGNNSKLNLSFNHKFIYQGDNKYDQELYAY